MPEISEKEKALRKRMWTAGVSLVSALALSASLGAGMALAAGTTDISDIDGGNGANWTVPTAPMTNTVWKDKDGNVVAEGTEGATQYKVLTTWAEAWSTSGPDYLGVSNSAYFGNGGNGNAKVTNYVQAQKNSMVGIWATSANTNANAYNWNIFYNFYAEAANKTPTDWASTSTTTNGGSDWDSSSGVWCGFKYRPEVVWLNNNLNETAAKTYIKQIQDGQYSATATKGSGQNATYAPDQTDGAYDSSFAIDGDADYNPQIIQPNNNSPYSFVASAYELADAVDKVIENTKNNPGLAEGDTLNWRTVNKLPRSNRYTETPDEIALNIEKLARGSVYYTLSKIADGSQAKKKVAYVAYPWSHSVTGRNGVTTNYTDDTQVIVAVYDYTENIGSGPMDGRASWSPLVVDQLYADAGQDASNVYAKRQGGGAVSSGDNSTTTYTLYYATADDLANCDVIYSPHNSKTATEWQEWISKNASPANAAKASSISYVAASPAITNGSNFTMEKLIYGAYAMDTIYPELFPNMQLSTYWFSQIYHIKAANLAETMSWGYAKASLPTGTSLAKIGTGFDVNKVLNNFEAGYKYYQKANGTDATMKRVLANTALDGSTQDASENAYAFNGFAPSTTWVAEDHSKYTATPSTPAAAAKKAQTIKVKKAKVTKTYKGKKAGKTKKLAAKKTIKSLKSVFGISGNKGALTFKKSSGNAKVTVSKAGKVTIKKGLKKGSYTIKVKVAAAATSAYKAANKTVTLVVKVK